MVRKLRVGCSQTRFDGSQTSLGKFGFAKVRLRQCAGSIVYIPLPLCQQYSEDGHKFGNTKSGVMSMEAVKSLSFGRAVYVVISCARSLLPMTTPQESSPGR